MRKNSSKVSFKRTQKTRVCRNKWNRLTNTFRKTSLIWRYIKTGIYSTITIKKLRIPNKEIEICFRKSSCLSTTRLCMNPKARYTKECTSKLFLNTSSTSKKWCQINCKTQSSKSKWKLLKTKKRRGCPRQTTWNFWSLKSILWSSMSGSTKCTTLFSPVSKSPRHLKLKQKLIKRCILRKTKFRASSR